MKLTPTPLLKKEGLKSQRMQIKKLSITPLFFKRGVGGEFKRIKFFFFILLYSYNFTKQTGFLLNENLLLWQNHKINAKH